MLHEYIGKICHVYLDDIIIWSDSIDEHIHNVQTIMQALQRAKLYVNKKKTHLFCHEVKFLGHWILQAGIEADNEKVSVRGHPSKLIPITKSNDPAPASTPTFYIPPHRRQVQEESP